MSGFNPIGDILSELQGLMNSAGLDNIYIEFDGQPLDKKLTLPCVVLEMKSFDFGERMRISSAVDSRRINAVVGCSILCSAEDEFDSLLGLFDNFVMTGVNASIQCIGGVAYKKADFCRELNCLRACVELKISGLYIFGTEVGG